MSGKTRTGWVYVLTNVSIPDQVKVGFTSGHPEDRARELEGTHLPTRFEVATAFLFVDHARMIEQKAHSLLHEYRVSLEREWFRCSPKDAATAIHEAARELQQVPVTISPEILSKQEIKARELRLLEKERREQQIHDAEKRREEQQSQIAGKKREEEKLRIAEEQRFQQANRRQQRQEKIPWSVGCFGMLGLLITMFLPVESREISFWIFGMIAAGGLIYGYCDDLEKRAENRRNEKREKEKKERLRRWEVGQKRKISPLRIRRKK
jgi:hypothetical protein